MLALILASGEGVTIGAHRLYAHKAFKARFPLRLALILLQTIAGQVSEINFVNFHYLARKLRPQNGIVSITLHSLAEFKLNR